MFSKGQCHEIFGKRRGKLDVKLFLKLVHKSVFLIPILFSNMVLSNTKSTAKVD